MGPLLVFGGIHGGAALVVRILVALMIRPRGAGALGQGVSHAEEVPQRLIPFSRGRVGGGCPHPPPPFSAMPVMHGVFIRH